MGVKWTKEQKAAIDARDCDLLVAAAAGSGKTAVLVERIINRVLDEKNPVDIDRLLVVTFTNAAALEMKERIAKAIAEKIAEVAKEGTTQRYNWLKRQLALINKATITTIHSFCQNVIKTYYQKINIDPAFKVMDEAQIDIIKSEIMDNLLDELYEVKENDEIFTDLVDCYGGGRSDEGLKELVLRISNFISSSPYPEEWLNVHTEKFNLQDIIAKATETSVENLGETSGVTLGENIGKTSDETSGKTSDENIAEKSDKDIDFSKTIWGSIIVQNLKITLENALIRTKQMMELAQEADLLGYFDTLVEDKHNFEKLINIVNSEGSTWDEIYNVLNQITFNRLGYCGKNPDKDAQEEIKEIREKVKASINKFIISILNERSIEIYKDMYSMYPLLKELKYIVLEFNSRYKEYKRTKCLIDFNDMEHYALEILAERKEDGSIKPSNVALEYQKHFEEVYIDEYQDSNLTQELILSLVSRSLEESKELNGNKESNMFMVGDIKQSIYGFRQARPDIFLGKYNEYPTTLGGDKRLIQLYKNFRSRKDVVGSINYIFSRIMSKESGELEYNEEEYLYYGADYPESDSDTSCELILGDLFVGAEEAKSISGEIPSKQEFEAKLIANRINELVYGDKVNQKEPFKVYDRKLGIFRNIKFSDIVILMRSTVNGEIFQEELIANEIPVFFDKGSGFFKSREVELILSLLRIIDNPNQDIPLIAVLRSVIGNFSDEDLVDIRLIDKSDRFYNNFYRAAEDEGVEEELRIKVKDFISNLDRWRKYSFELTTSELLWKLYEETNYYDFVGILLNGEEKKANLRMLFEKAVQFESTGTVGIFNFLNYIDKLSNHGDVGGATVLGENDNVVRIMSIHKSKGLEFPVVFVAECGKNFNKQDLNEKIILHQDLGFGPDFIDPNLRIIYSTKAKLALRLKHNAEFIAEEMRVLYVALTRAKEKLIITGTLKNAVEELHSMWDKVYDGKLSSYNVINAVSYLDMMLPILLRHPHMEEMRRLADVSWNEGILMPRKNEESTWSFSYNNLCDYISEEGESGKIDKSLEGKISEKDPFDYLLEHEENEDEDNIKTVRQRVLDQLTWEYPYQKDTKMPIKITVSELKRLKETSSEEGERLYSYIPKLINKPKFITGKEHVTAAQKGSVIHYVLQNINLDIIRDKLNSVTEEEAFNELTQVVTSEIEKLCEKKMITKEEASWVNAKLIARFLISPIGRRMLKSEKVNREVPFTMYISSKEVYPDLSDSYAEEKIAIQGIIDCYFQEGNEFILIDYKTDRVEQSLINEYSEKYKIQIKTYKNAIERGTGSKVKEAYIYFLSINDYVKVEV